MPAIDWDGNLETGDALVDAHHRTIHELFNDLENGSPAESEIMRALTFLTEYVLMHFATEEDLMTRVAYPLERIQEHQTEHEKLTDGVRNMVLSFRTGALDGIEEIIEFLRPWLKHHIHEQDRKLVEHCKLRGEVARVPEPWATEGLPRRAS